MNSRDTLPVHSVRDQEMRLDDASGGITVCGLVERLRVLSGAELAPLPHERRTERFVCEEG